MRLSISLLLLFVSLIALHPTSARADSIDGRVIQVTLPVEDVTLFYVERNFFTVRLQTNTATVEGRKMYIGDGKIAIDLVAHSSKGIFLQGVKYRQGDQFKKGSNIKVLPGYKKATALRAGDVYVILPGVLFKLPKK